MVVVVVVGSNQVARVQCQGQGHQLEDQPPLTTILLIGQLQSIETSKNVTVNNSKGYRVLKDIYLGLNFRPQPKKEGILSTWDFSLRTMRTSIGLDTFTLSHL